MPVYQPNIEYIRQAQQSQQERASRRERGELKFYTIEANSALYFFLLPPWSERGALGRLVYTHFQIPEAKAYQCWKTYDVLKPGIGITCPVCDALKSVSASDSPAIKKMYPHAKGNINAKLIGSRKLNASGDPQDPFYPIEQTGPIILQLPPSVFEGILTMQNNPKIGFICMPDSAVMIIVKKSGLKLDTEYKFNLEGSEDVSGFTPKRVSMFSSEGERDLYLNHLFNLDNIWTMPSTEDTSLGHKISGAIRATYGVVGNTMIPPTSQQPLPWENHPQPQGSTLSTPMAPALPPAFQTPPVASQVPPAATPAVDQSVSQFVDPPIPGMTVERMAKEQLGSKPCGDPNEPKKPLCHRNYSLTQSGPNKAWCTTCFLQQPCRLLPPKK
jgi:hypothetical protein